MITTIDLSRYVQVEDSDRANIAKKRTSGIV